MTKEAEQEPKPSSSNSLSGFFGNRWVLGVLCFLLLLPGYFYNLWQAVDDETFETFMIDSEAKVLGRLVESRDNHPFTYGGLQGRLNSEELSKLEGGDSQRVKWLYAYGVFFDEKEHEGTFSPYLSHHDAQGILFSIADRVLPFEPYTNYNLFRLFNCILLAALLSIFLVWVRTEFGWTAAILSVLALMYSRWMTFFAPHLHWSTWSMFVPMITLLVGMWRKWPFRKLMMTAAIAMFIKHLFGGYEYVTTIYMMAVAPMVYYGIRNREKVSGLIRRCFFIGLAMGAATIVSFVLLTVQIWVAKGSFTKAVDHIFINSVDKRVMGNPELHPEVYHKVLNNSIWDMILYYAFSKHAFNFTRQWQLNGATITYAHVGIGALLVIIAIAMRTLQRKRLNLLGESDWRLIALVATMVYGFAASCSWHIIFSAHSKVHVHMNAFLWQLGCSLFVFALFGYAMRIFCGREVARAEKKKKTETVVEERPSLNLKLDYPKKKAEGSPETDVPEGFEDLPEPPPPPTGRGLLDK